MKKHCLVMVMRDQIPAKRPDVKELFGNQLPRFGINCDLVGPGTQNPDHDSQIWPAGQLSITKTGGMLGEALKSYRDLRAILKLQRRHDIIQVRDRTFSAISPWLISRYLKKQFVFWMSFPIVEGYEARAREVGRKNGVLVYLANNLRAIVARMAYYGFIAKRADHVFVQSEAMLEWMHTKGIPRERMTAVPMGVDTEALARNPVLAADDERLTGRRVVIYLGSLGLAREPGFMLEVIAEVRQRYPDVLLVLAGDGDAPDEQAWLRRRIDEMDLQQHVWLTGWLPQAQALRLVKRAELGLSPIPRGPLYDVSSPTKAMEYLALGVPCVGNDIPDQRYVLERSGAGICAPMTVAAFVTAVESLLADADGARSMGARGPAFIARERSYEVLASQVATVYHRLLASHKS
jgi:glycosyltransferase involved in cell wall biosynthesis